MFGNDDDKTVLNTLLATLTDSINELVKRIAGICALLRDEVTTAPMSGGLAVSV